CDFHPQLAAGSAEIGAGQGRGLRWVARDRDANEILAADQSVRRVEFDPAGARQIDLAPGVRRPAAQPNGLVLPLWNKDIAETKRAATPSARAASIIRTAKSR